ncbi:MAG: hypothetical protein ACI9IL_000988, partial [Rickettsiales bacterium]
MRKDMVPDPTPTLLSNLNSTRILKKLNLLCKLT